MSSMENKKKETVQDPANVALIRSVVIALACGVVLGIILSLVKINVFFVIVCALVAAVIVFVILLSMNNKTATEAPKSEPVLAEGETYYTILDADPLTPQVEMKERYDRAIQLLELKQTGKSFAVTSKEMNKVITAYNTLKDPELRAEYDRKLGFVKLDSQDEK